MGVRAHRWSVYMRVSVRGGCMVCANALVEMKVRALAVDLSEVEQIKGGRQMCAHHVHRYMRSCVFGSVSSFN